MSVDLYYLPGAASLAPHAVLIETGTPHRLVRVRRDEHGDPPPEYLAVNPTGRVPTAVEDGHVVTEAAAICMTYADRAPASGMAPPPGSAARGDWYRWHCTLTNSVQEAFYRLLRPQRFTADAAGADAVRDAARADLGRWRGVIAAALDGREYLAGDACTSADIYLCMLTRWCRRLPEGERYGDDPALAAHFRRVADRPSCRAAWEREGLDRDGEPA